MRTPRGEQSKERRPPESNTKIPHAPRKCMVHGAERARKANTPVYGHYHLRFGHQANTAGTTPPETTGNRKHDDAGIADMTSSRARYCYTLADASRHMDTTQNQPARATATRDDDWITTTDVCGGTSEYVLVAPDGKTGCTSTHDTRGVIGAIVPTNSTETGTELRCHSTIEPPSARLRPPPAPPSHTQPSTNPPKRPTTTTAIDITARNWGAG